MSSDITFSVGADAVFGLCTAVFLGSNPEESSGNYLFTFMDLTSVGDNLGGKEDVYPCTSSFLRRTNICDINLIGTVNSGQIARRILEQQYFLPEKRYTNLGTSFYRDANERDC